MNQTGELPNFLWIATVKTSSCEKNGTIYIYPQAPCKRRTASKEILLSPNIDKQIIMGANLLLINVIVYFRI